MILRLGMTFVFAWFGASQLVNASAWTSVVPGWATGFGMNAVTIVHLNGVFEIIAALLMGMGFWIRPVAALLALHLFVIATSLGLSAIGIRDFGLSFATLSIALRGKN